MAESKALTEEHNHAESHSGQPLSYNCLLVQGVPPNFDENDISTAVEVAFGDTVEGVSLSSRRPKTHVSCSGSDAIVTMPIAKGCTVPKEPVLVQCGEPESSKVTPLFAESTKMVVHVLTPVYPQVASDIEKRAQILQISVKLQSNTIRAYGTCRQLYKFREFLVNVLSNQARLLQPIPQECPMQKQPFQPQIQEMPFQPEQVNPQPQNGGASPLPPPPAGAREIANLSTDVLLLMPKLAYTNTPGIQYHPHEGRVFVFGDSEANRDSCCDAFLDAYHKVLQSLKNTSIAVQAEHPREEVRTLVANYNQRYNQCHFLFNEQNSTVNIVSASSRQFEQAKKFLTDIFFRPAACKDIENFVFSNGRTLTVKKADIVHEDCFIIVNAASSTLSHGAGVAGALNEASNGELQRHSDVYIRQQGQVPVGFVAQTKAGGKLKCKFVLHAVGPRASDPGMNDDQCGLLIHQATTRALALALKLKAVSIAFPALSTGIYGVNRSVSARAMIKAIVEFQYTKPKALTDIRIVIVDAPTYICFAQELVLKRTLASAAGGSAGSAPDTAAQSSQTASALSTQIENGSKKSSNTVKLALTLPPSSNIDNGGSNPTQPKVSTPPGILSQSTHPVTPGLQAMLHSSSPSHIKSTNGEPLAASFGGSGNGNQSATATAQNPSCGKDTTPSDSKPESCPICLDDKITNAVKLKCCKQKLCKSCLDTCLVHSPYCPTCKYPLRPIVGNQPDGTMTSHSISTSLPGYNQCATIVITYNFPNGTQNQHHPNPGKRYQGTNRIAYLPDCREGQEVLALLKRAFEQRLVFTVGRSSTTGVDNVVVWNDIHHKTNMYGGAYGYPDDTYFHRVKEELKAKGIY